MPEPLERDAVLRNILSFAPLAARDPGEAHRASTQLELFFDLISVIAIASVTGNLHHAISEGHGLAALPVFAFLFTAIWWAWMNFTWFASAFDNDAPGYRLLVMTIIAGELIFAGGAGYIFQTLDFSWGLLGWILMRLGMASLWLRASACATHRLTTLRYAAGISVAQGCWVLLYLLAEPASVTFFVCVALCFVVEFAVPPIAESAGATPFHRHHIIERYGLLTIISLGEIMLSISLGFGMLYGGHADMGSALTALAALVIVFAVFWIYFCEEEHLPSEALLTAIVWGYGHVFTFGAIAALGAGVAAELDLAGHHGAASQGGVAWWMGGPLAVVFAALWLTRDRHFALGARGPALPVMALAALAAAWSGLSSWGFAAVAVAALVWRVPMGHGAD